MTIHAQDIWRSSISQVQATIETISGWVFGPGSPLPGLLLIQIRDSEGVTGVGETFYAPRACWASIEEIFARHLMGRRIADLESFFQTQQASLRRFVGMGAEYRALSALDVALWDLVAHQREMPLRHVLRPDASASIPVYNTCAGPEYSSSASAPGEGTSNDLDERDDYAAWKRNGGALARDLIAEGFSGMKLWPLDDLAKAIGGSVPTQEQIRDACTPLQSIRDAVGSDIDIMVDGHGLWDIESAIVIADYCESFDLRWFEDLTLAHPASMLRTLKDRIRTPILASEYLSTVSEFNQLLAMEAVDIVMVDPTWAGGVTNAMSIANIAHSYGLSISFHDCTGPATLIAGASMACAIPNHEIQEVARSFLRYTYPQIAEMDAELHEGHLGLGTVAGLGITLNPDLNRIPGVVEFQYFQEAR
jgi:galactonate dehydratase